MAWDSRRVAEKQWLANPFSRSSLALPTHSSRSRSEKSGLWRDTSSILRLPSRNDIQRSLLDWMSLPQTRPTIRSGDVDTAIPRVLIPSASTFRFVSLCALWYTTSALSSNTGKTILMQFRYPITLTFVQFGFVAAYCLLFMSPLLRFSRLRMPTNAIIRSTLPMGMFQVGGHMFSSMAISRIPVSTVHTIKALSPLFTVAAYALLFNVSYSTSTYISLLPLTIGVMLACSFDISASNVIGLLCAFASALVFVSSNIFFKKVMPSNSNEHSSHKLDKINLLFYSSSMAFLMTFPMWLYYDVPQYLSTSESGSTHIVHPVHGHSAPHSVLYYVIMNCTVHFAQNIIAFVILASTSPVTYSIASLVKRVVVICVAIVWFAQTVHPVQGGGIVLTFAGLWMYNSARGDVARGESKMRRVEAARGLVLPSTRAEVAEEQEAVAAESTAMRSGAGYGRARTASIAAPTPKAARHHALPPALEIMPPSSTDTKKRLSTMSPTDSYPSPPPSLDSPPSTPVVMAR